MPALPWRNFDHVDLASTYVVTITRLPLRSYLQIPRVMRATLRIMRELKRSEGLIGYALKACLLRKTFWTASAWRDEAALHRFVRSGTHTTAMIALQRHMAGSHIATFTMHGAALPPRWSDITTRLGPATS